MLRCDDLMNGYHIYQDPEMFCFGIDAVLLAHFPSLRRQEQVMDLCTGFAPIPLILHAEAKKRGYPIRITGVEIQERAAEIARRSVEENGLRDAISIVTGDIREAGANFSPASFSLVTCNPPYLPVGGGFLPEDPAKAMARTELGCTLEDVVQAASFLLKGSGRFAMIHRPERLPEICEGLRAHHLEPKRLRFVHPRVEESPTMVLVEATKSGRAGLRVEPPLIVRGADNEYTKEIYDIYGWDAVSGGDAHRES